MAIRPIFIKSSEEKQSGQGQYGTWHRYEVYDDHGNKYTSFDERVHKSVGHVIQVNAELQTREKNGNQYTNVVLKLVECTGKCPLHCGEEPENFQNA